MARARRPETGLTEGNEDNKGLQRGGEHNLCFVRYLLFRIFCSLCSVFLVCPYP
jgi:hypothetical protein